jgi:uncharacterized membrane protein YeaQ/YmgE (transglycosylase-associated protein family)
VVLADVKTAKITALTIAIYNDEELSKYWGNNEIPPSDSQQLDRYGYCRNNPVKFIDTTGHWVNIIAGAVIGAFVGVAKYACMNILVQKQEFSWGSFGGTVAGSVVAGAIASTGGGLLGMMASGAVGNVAGTQVNSLISTGKSATSKQLVVAGVIGAAGGAVAKGLTPYFSKALGNASYITDDLKIMPLTEAGATDNAFTASILTDLSLNLLSSTKKFSLFKIAAYSE